MNLIHKSLLFSFLLSMKKKMAIFNRKFNIRSELIRIEDPVEYLKYLVLLAGTEPN